MMLTATQIDILERLSRGETVARSNFQKKLLDRLQSERLLAVNQQKSRVSFYVLNQKNFGEFLRINKWDNFEHLRELSAKEDLSRAQMVQECGNSKERRKRTFQGFLINSCEPIPATLNGKEICINPTKGSFIFVSHYKQFFIPEDVLIVGMENSECFDNVADYRYLFNSRVLFVTRYPQNNSKDLVSWLQTIPNQYVHFGDFDLAGINIYQTEFYEKLGAAKASFLIPNDVEKRIKENGNANIYDKQYVKYHSLKAMDPRMKDLIDTINHFHRIYEQEGYAQRSVC